MRIRRTGRFSFWAAALFGGLAAALAAGCTSIIGSFEVGDGGTADSGGDGGRDAGKDAKPKPDHATRDTSPQEFQVGGVVKGLKGKGLVLQNNGGDDQSISGNGAFTFSTPLAKGSSYDVTILDQPKGQACSVMNGTGAVTKDVTDIVVMCGQAYTIGGTLSGMYSGNSLTLENEISDKLTLNSNGAFTFKTAVADGASYSVKVKAAPSTPTQTCTVTKAKGSVAGADVTDVLVTCNDCGRFTAGHKGSWTTLYAANPLNAGMGISAYLPPGGPNAIYITGQGPPYYTPTIAALTAGTFASLSAPPTGFGSYTNVAYSGGSLWSIEGGNALNYDPTTDVWTSTPYVPSMSQAQTTADDSGNVWSFSADTYAGTTLVEFEIATGTTTMFPLPTISYSGSEPRIVYDSCSALFYLTDYSAPSFYSYDPVKNVQKMLSGLPSADGGPPLTFQDGFCGDRSGHIFAVTNSATAYQYDIATDVWTAMPAGGPIGNSNSACGVGSDGNLYATDPGKSSTIYQIALH